MDDFDREIKQDFINEALINLEETESSFMELETASEPAPLLEKIFRLAHNLKGGSRAVGFGDVAEFTHELENLVLKIQRSEVRLSPEVVTTLLKSNDRLIFLLQGLKKDLGSTHDSTELISELRSWIDGTRLTSALPSDLSEGAEEKAWEPPRHVTTDDIETVEIPPSSDEFSDWVEPQPAAQALPEPLEATPVLNDKKAEGAVESHKLKPPADEVVRVGLSKVNRLNDFVGELVVLQEVIGQQASLSQSPLLLNSIRQMQKTTREIQNIAMSLRLLPVKPLVQKLQRVVRDTAQALKKDVELKITGEHVDIDKSVLDELADPLIHILRNAVDHGLETPEERGANSKSPKGLVHLSFANEGNHLIVQIKDDGKGISTDLLKSKAISKKILRPEQEITEKEALRLIFHPGFSTKEVTSEISGRGVGMDVVKTNIEKIGGQIDIHTKVGLGSVFTLQIPLSLAIIESLIVKSGDSRYSVPLNAIQESINLKSHAVFENKLGIGPCLELRGSVLPLYSLSEIVSPKKDPNWLENSIALIVNVEGHLAGIVIQDILRAQQVVIKPFGNGISAQKGWVGTCILGDGQPTLIVNPAELLKGKIRHNQTQTEIRGVAS